MKTLPQTSTRNRPAVLIYRDFLAQFLKSRLAYRGDFIAGALSNLLFTSFGLIYILLLFGEDGARSLAGWNRSEVLFVYGYSMMAMGLFNVVAPNLYQFGDKYIIQGQFDRLLLRPLHTLAQVLCESFNISALGGTFVGLGISVFSVRSLGLQFSWVEVLWLAVSVPCGALILLGVFVILASLSFHFEDRSGLSAPIYNLFNFARYPVTIFDGALQFVLRWVIPFAFVSFYPATFFLKRTEFSFYCFLTPVVAALTTVLSLWSWRLGENRYASTGS